MELNLMCFILSEKMFFLIYVIVVHFGQCYSMDGPLSFSFTLDSPACSSPHPLPHMQPLDKPSRRNGMILHQIMPMDNTFLSPLPCHGSLGQWPEI